MGEVTRYTLAEVAKRNGKNNEPVWIIYKDSVYDVTSYIPEHPPGDTITEEGGKDVTRDFDDAGHTADAKFIMKKYKIGEIVEEERKYDANGKKKKTKKVVPVPPEGKNNRSCINVVTCGLLG
ncbi:cytochrome b5-like [Epargyreus clarus]|uniref:cytochrome b5-like n=1 Tax=Epargyreus clarus TaxID=520877 RepID=UPI003C2E24C3